MYLSTAKNYGYHKKTQLKKQEVKIWHSFTERGEYQGADPSYFDVSSFDWYALLKNNTEVFKKEVLETKGEIFIPYYNRTFSKSPESWKIIPLFSWLKRFDTNLAKMPKSKNILSQIPFLVSAAYSQLDNSSLIKEHIGDSNAMYRVHIPLVIPAGLPECGIEVLKERREWVVGAPFAFCDAHKHRAWNNTNEKRIVLLLDIIRPEFTSKTKWICAQMRSSLVLQFLFQKTKLIHKLPRFMRIFLMNFGAGIIYPFLLNKTTARGK